MPTVAARLDVLYEVNRRLASFTDLSELLRYATRRTRELFEAEGCAVLLLDQGRGELYFPVASQSASHPDSEARLAEISFPADRGIAGWVVRHGQGALVHDVSADPRFYAEVDRKTSVSTRAVLCAPLRTAWGIIGAIEVVNPARPWTPEDLEFLLALAGDIAVAHEKVALQEELRGEVVGLRLVLALLGTGLLALGGLTVVAATLVHVAWALPLGELPTRPGMLLGLVLVLVGGVLLAVGRGWLVRRTPPPRTARPV
jgi:GAF domain-containing protein